LGFSFVDEGKFAASAIPLDLLVVFRVSLPVQAGFSGGPLGGQRYGRFA